MNKNLENNNIKEIAMEDIDISSLISKSDLSKVLKTSKPIDLAIDESFDFKNIEFLDNLNELVNLEEFVDEGVKNYLLSQKEYLFEEMPKFGEVWIVDLGKSVGSEIGKTRPCIIISNNLNNKKGKTVTVVPITSTVSSFISHGEITEETFIMTESTISGTMKCEQMTTVSKGRLDRKVGRLSNKGFYQLFDKIFAHLNIPFLLNTTFKECDYTKVNKFEETDDFIKDLNAAKRVSKRKHYIKSNEKKEFLIEEEIQYQQDNIHNLDMTISSIEYNIEFLEKKLSGLKSNLNKKKEIRESLTEKVKKLLEMEK